MFWWAVCLLLIDNILFGDKCWQTIAEIISSQNIVFINKTVTVTFIILSLIIPKEPTRNFQNNPTIFTLHFLLLHLRFLPKRRNIFMFWCKVIDKSSCFASRSLPHYDRLLYNLKDIAKLALSVVSGTRWIRP